jgi:hypothetical protein
MYKRTKKWMPAISPSTFSESDWENTFTTEEDDIVDIRFSLKGYGWKPNVSDENLNTLEKGSYRIYYRVSGSGTWLFLARAESNRASQDVVNVYSRTAIATGLIESGKYEIKIVADKGSKFTGWGGAIEGIASGERFWENLQIRSSGVKDALVNEAFSVSENVTIGLS